MRNRNGIYYRRALADWLTPTSAFMRIADGAERAFLLESVEGGERLGRYSFLGAHPTKTLHGGWEEFKRSLPSLKPEPDGLPPFTGGAVGVFSYELARAFESLPGRDSVSAWSGKPILMDYYHTVVAFDHVMHQILILSHESKERVEEIESLLVCRPREAESLLDVDSIADPADLVLESSPSREEYCRAVELVKESIRAGDIFQAVLSQNFSRRFEGDPFSVYRALRCINPSPYLFYLKMGDICLAGSSPEMLLRVKGSQLDYRPIAGTRKRGKSDPDDRRLEAELKGDEKEKAEHLMLVDLGRNDLGRVSRYGSVKVGDFMKIEKYSHVMHLVSSLSGELREECDRFDALQACFPAGTVTGAPKVRAMQIIDEVEPHPRGIYAGAVGYLDFCGNLDTCIAIRTLVFQGNRVSLQAGAGIVADSVAESEFKECRNKAAALLAALELSSRLPGRQGGVR